MQGVSRLEHFSSYFPNRNKNLRKFIYLSLKSFTKPNFGFLNVFIRPIEGSKK